MPGPTSLAGYNLRSPSFIEDPFSFYARLRDEDPVQFVPEFDSW